MDRAHEDYQSYSWHQSHDQATVLLLVPYDTVEDDVSVIFERNILVAGVRGQSPIVKGRLYGNLDVANSSWQLEPRSSAFSTRERTTSTTSTTSTQSSFAIVSETEISSSFAASVEGLASDLDEPYVSSPALSSPISSSDDHNGFTSHGTARRHTRFTTSHPVSPHTVNPSLSLASSYSSLESLHTGSGRLLTIHLEKAESVIWPSLVVGPVPEALSPCNSSIYPWFTRTSSSSAESRYNMDPTSLVLIALELSDIRDEKEEAFEYFVRAWHQAHVPSATIRLASNYLPVTAVISEASSPVDTPTTPTGDSSPSMISISPSATPTPIHASASFVERASLPLPGSLSYYFHHIGGAQQLAQLYLETGLLYLEGTASGLLSSSYAGLSSLRTPTMSVTQSQQHSRPHHLDPHTFAASGANGSEAWRRDQEVSRRYFDRARDLHPGLDVPLLPPSDSDPESHDSPVSGGEQQQWKMPTIEIPEAHGDPEKQVRRRQRKETASSNAASVAASGESAVNNRLGADEDDNTWYLYLPGLVGAGTALLVVGFLSFSSWRKSQTS